VSEEHRAVSIGERGAAVSGDRGAPATGEHGAAAIGGLRIGAVTTRTNLVLSPMSGVTDCAFRMLVRACSGDSVGLVVSEFIAAEGLTRDNEKTLRMLRHDESERPLSIQIFGADAERMVRAACMVEDAGADIVDINCGCPAPKVVRRGGGAELMRQSASLATILRSVRRAVSIPVTVKIRAGWDCDSINASDIARLVESEGADMLAVHGRTRVQLYSGSADWDLVADIREQLSIPVIGSGDVVDADGALERLTGGYADGVMVGRAAMGNPWIFAQIEAAAGGRPVLQPGRQERVRALRTFRDLLREHACDRRYLGRFRGLACRLVKGMRESAAVRRAIGAADSIEGVEAVFTEYVLHGPETVDHATAVA